MIIRHHSCTGFAVTRGSARASSSLRAVRPQADDRRFRRWFKYALEIDEHGTLPAIAAKPMVVTIRRKETQKGAQKRVLVLYPRPPRLRHRHHQDPHVFMAKELNAELTVVNFELKDERGDEAIKFAVDKKFDLIFAMGSESTAWLYDNYRQRRDPCRVGLLEGPGTARPGQGLRDTAAAPISPSPRSTCRSRCRWPTCIELKPDLKNLAMLVDSKNISAVQTQSKPIAELRREARHPVILGSASRTRARRARSCSDHSG